MMSTLGAVGIMALLFVVYGVLRPRDRCGKSCGECDHSCKVREFSHGQR